MSRFRASVCFWLCDRFIHSLTSLGCLFPPSGAKHSQPTVYVKRQGLLVVNAEAASFTLGKDVPVPTTVHVEVNIKGHTFTSTRATLGRVTVRAGVCVCFLDVPSFFCSFSEMCRVVGMIVLQRRKS